MRRKRRFKSRRHADEQHHPIPVASSSVSIENALRTGHFTPDVVMTLQRTIGNQAVIQRLGNGEPATGASAQSEAEKRLKEIIASLNPKKKDDKGDTEQYKKALQEALKALLKTDTGKDLKKRAIELATSGEGLPFSILIGSGALAALFASNAGIPAIPDIPVGEGMSISIELEGTMQEPTGIKFGFTYRFGGSKGKPSTKAKEATELPPAVLEMLKEVDERLISEWILARAEHEYKTAAPDQKPLEKMILDEFKGDPGSLPNTHLIIEGLARLLIEKAGEKRIEFDLQHGGIWDTFHDLGGLVNILAGIVPMLLPALPEPAQEVEQITFKAGKKIIPIPVKKLEKEAK